MDTQIIMNVFHTIKLFQKKIYMYRKEEKRIHIEVC